MSWDSSFAEEQDYVRAVFYGDPGSGKTTDAASIAHLGKTLFFPIEPGLKKTALAARGIPLDKIVPQRVYAPEQIMEVFWKLKGRLHDEPGCVAGVVFDSATEWVKRVIGDITKREYIKGKERAEAAGEEYDKPRHWTSRDYFAEMTQDVREVIEHFHDLPCHLAFTAHVRRDEDDDGEVTYGPHTTPAVQSDLVAYCDLLIWTREVGRYPDGRPIMIGQTGNGGKYKVKDRFGVLPKPSLVYPTMDRIVGYVNGTLTEPTDPLQVEYLEWKNDVAKARVTKKEK